MNESFAATEPNNNVIHIVTEVLTIAFRIVLSLIGTYINLKIIFVSKRDQHKTWQIDIVRSIAVIPLIYFAITFEAINDYFSNPISNYTGVSICYIAAFVYVYLPYLVALHSLVVSIMKYVFIVHQQKAIEIGEDRIKQWFFWFNLIHPLVIAISTVLLFDVESFASLIKCFGLEQKLAERYSSPTGNLERMFLCKLRSSERDMEEGNAIYIFTQTFCAIKMVYFWILSSNIIEAFFYYKIFKEMRRTIEPSSDNKAAKSLNKTNQARNIRKMKVNANVTFVIWILEWIANIFAYICWILGPNFTRYFPEVVLIWYYVILPHTFLMNTSHNKDLIVDDGLKTTLVNAFGNPFSLRRKSNTVHVISQNKEKKPKNALINDESKRDSNNDDKDDCFENNESKIYTISKNELLSTEMKTMEINDHDLPKITQSTSTGKTASLKKRYNYDTFNQSLSDSDVDEYSEDYQDRSHELATEILSYMIRNVHSEEIYLHYFVQILHFNDETKFGRNKMSEVFHLCPADEIVNEDSARQLQENLRGNADDRINLRKILLDRLKSNCEDSDEFKKALSELIDFEESLVR